VESIKVFTSGCTGCSASNEGVTVELLGEKNANFFDGVPCSTRVLDHKATTDFASSGSAVFDGKKNGHEDEGERTMMGTCYEAALNAQLSNGGSITWEGEGTWTPQASGGVCVDWQDAASFAWACDITGSGPSYTLTNCVSLAPATSC